MANISRPIYLIHLGNCALTAQTLETRSIEKALNWFKKSDNGTQYLNVSFKDGVQYESELVS